MTLENLIQGSFTWGKAYTYGWCEDKERSKHNIREYAVYII